MASTKKTPNSTQTIKRTHKERALRWFSGIASALIVLLLLLLHSAYWMNQNFINSQNFSQKVSNVLALDSSREAIGNEVSDQVFKDKPILGRVAGDKLASIVTSLLGTDIANKLLTRVSNDTVVYLTASKQKPIEVNLSEIKPVIIAVSKAVDTIEKKDTASIDVSSIPDKIVLVQPGTIPSFYKYSVILAWMVPFAALLSVGLFVLIVRLRKLSIRQSLKRAGLIIMTSSIVGMIIGPVVKPPAIAMLQSTNLRTLTSNLYDAFWSPFLAQMSYMFMLGLLIFVISYVRLSRPSFLQKAK